MSEADDLSVLCFIEAKRLDQTYFRVW